MYILENSTYNQTSASCSGQTIAFHGNFYHGSIGYYAIYAETQGAYCMQDGTAYLTVSGRGTYDINELRLAQDRGDVEFRMPYWCIFTGTSFTLVRILTLRRSFVSCRRFAKHCDQMTEPIRIQEAIVYVQESLRLPAHGAKNVHRLLLMFLLVDQGVMSDFFLLSTQEGLFGRIQSISLGYNLAGLMSMLFEMVETMNWMSEKLRCQVKRLLFNYETVLVGEFITAAVLPHYLTSLSSRIRSPQLKWCHTTSWGCSCSPWDALRSSCPREQSVQSDLCGGGLLLTKTCSVDAVLRARSKLVLLHGYVWENGEQYYRPRLLKALGVLRQSNLTGGSCSCTRRCTGYRLLTTILPYWGLWKTEE